MPGSTSRSVSADGLLRRGAALLHSLVGGAPSGGPGGPEPFFAAPGAAPRRGRLLLISYHFPPARTAGALRWQKLARFAAERGWSLDVVTLLPAGTPPPGTAGLDELPPGTRVFGVATRPLPLDRLEDALWTRLTAASRAASSAATTTEGARGGAGERRPRRPESLSRAEMERGIRTVRDGIRAWHSLRSVAQEGAWAEDAAAIAARIAAAHEALITCGPPHTVHHVGRRLAGRLGIPLVLDMRDPWSLVERLPESVASAAWLRVAARRERAAVAAARLVVANTEPAAEALRRVHPAAAARIVSVMNGFDDPPPPSRPRGDRFLIAYAGSIYLDRDPGVLFRPAARLVRHLGLTPDEFGIELMGHVQSFDGVGIDDLCRDAGLDGYVRSHPAGSRGDAAALLGRAALLVSLPQDSALAIPSKIFEYLQFPAWTLAMADPGSATEMALRGSEADVVGTRDEEGVYRVLETRFTQYRNGVRPARPRTAEHLSRRHQADRFFDALEERLGGGRPRTTIGPRLTAGTPDDG
jgi:hypothetical protein